MFIHHETISARTASESNGLGHFNVIETDEGFTVYDGDSAYPLHECYTLPEAVELAQMEADRYDRRNRKADPMDSDDAEMDLLNGMLAERDRGETG